MPAMYPEELRSLREQNPGLQFDFRGNLIDDGGYGDALAQQVQDLFYRQPDYDAAQPSWNQLYQNYGPANGDALSRAVAGLDGYSYQNDQFVGPVLPGQQGYTYSDYDQAGPLQPGVSNLSLPNVGFYSQWDPGTNSWVRHGAPSGGYAPAQTQRAARPSYGPRVRSQAPASGGQMLPPEVRYRQDEGVDPAYQAELLRQTNQMPFMQSTRRALRDAAAFGESFPNLAYQPE